MINCPAPWNHLFIQASGRMAPCCVYDLGEDAYDLSQEGSTIAEGLNFLHHTRTRKLMMENKWPQECQVCEHNENLGVPSKRQLVLDLPDNKDFSLNQVSKQTNSEGFYSYPKITSMFLELGNLCNLACPSCGALSSVRWYHLNHQLNQKYNLNLDESKIQYKWYKKPEIIEELKQHLETVETIQFAGGEPLLNPTHIKLLRHCIDINRAEQIELKYNTNGTVLPESLEELWGQFKQVQIYISCDGYDEKSVYYLRHPARLNKISENLRKIKSWQFNQLDLGMQSTINCINIFYLPEIEQLAIANGLSFNAAPVNHHVLELPMLPLSVKEIVKAKLEQVEFNQSWSAYLAQGLINLMMSEDRSERFPDLRVFLNRLDGVRDITLEQAFPEMAELINGVKQ